MRKRSGANYASKQKIIEDVINISEQVDYTIAVMHIGKELHEKLSVEELQLLESLKADLIVVHHAHMTQSINSEIIISCGDFIFNYPKHLPEKRLANLILYKYDKNIEVSKIELEIEEGIACIK